MQGNRNNTLYYATDPHLFFTFNELYSREWNLFIENTNKGGGTKTVASPDSSISFATPDYADTTYYLGTTKKQKTFKHTLAADGLTENDLDTILGMLKVGTEGFLVYDTNPYWGWDVVVTKVGDVTKYCAQNGLIVEFDIEFKTFGDWRAKGVYPASVTVDKTSISAQDSLTNEHGIPELVVPELVVSEEGSYNPECWFIPVSNESSTINVYAQGLTTEGNVTEASISGNETLLTTAVKDFAYYSDLGIALSGTHFIEELDLNAQVMRKMFDGAAPSLGAPFADGQECTENYDQSSYWYQCKVYKIDKLDYWDRVKTSVTIPTSEYAIQIFKLETATKTVDGGAKKTYVKAIQICSVSNKTEETSNTPIATYYGKCTHLTFGTTTTGSHTITVTKYKNL